MALKPLSGRASALCLNPPKPAQPLFAADAEIDPKRLAFCFLPDCHPTRRLSRFFACRRPPFLIFASLHAPIPPLPHFRHFAKQWGVSFGTFTHEGACAGLARKPCREIRHITVSARKGFSHKTNRPFPWCPASPGSPRRFASPHLFCHSGKFRHFLQSPLQLTLLTLGVRTMVWAAPHLLHDQRQIPSAPWRYDRVMSYFANMCAASFFILLFGFFLGLARGFMESRRLTLFPIPGVLLGALENRVFPKFGASTI